MWVHHDDCDDDDGGDDGDGDGDDGDADRRPKCWTAAVDASARPDVRAVRLWGSDVFCIYVEER